MNPTIVRCLAAALTLFCAAAGADILTLNGDKQIKGLIEDDGGGKGPVTIMTSKGRQKIPRERLKAVKKESRAESFAGLAGEHFKAGKMEDAAKAANMALESDAEFKPAKEILAEIDKVRDTEKKEMRKDQVQEIDKIRTEIRSRIGKGEFLESEELLKRSSDLVPTEEQRTGLKELVGELYLAWAKDRLDKFDRPGAEQKLNLALAAAPQNDEVIELLLTLWENQADKREQMLQIYETVLEKRPDDQTLRRKLADLYFDAGDLENSARHYLELYKSSDKYKGTPLEARVIENLDRLHGKFAMDKDYERAIYFFNLLAAIDPQADPMTLGRYEYLQKAAGVKGGDIAGRVELAAFAEERGMEQEALDNYRLALKEDPNSGEARKGLDRFAMSMIDQAEDSFNKKDYYLARALADRVRNDFKDSKEAGLRAEQIIAATKNEIEADARQAREQALQYVQRGDEYFQQAMVFYDRIFNSEYNRTNLRLSNPTSDARRYFRYAIDAYSAAVQIDPSLKSDGGSLVATRMEESRRYLQRLSSGPPPARKSYGRIIDPDSPSIRNDETGRRR